MDEYIRAWYIKNFPSDPVGEAINPDITFNELFEKLDNYLPVWDILARDSVVRSRCFNHLAELTGMDVDAICDQWLRASEG